MTTAGREVDGQLDAGTGLSDAVRIGRSGATYDFEGNLEKKSKAPADTTWTYFYDHQNQLTRVDKKATDGGTLQQRVDFKYAFGQRIEKVVDSNGDGTPDTITRFAYDGENVFADFATDSSLTTRYLRGDVIDQIFARVGAPGMAGELNWLLTDRLGSVHNVLGAAGTILATLVYDAFGNITTESDASKTGRYTWTGRERDVEIDLQYNRARYYDPATGRWIHRDPLGFDAGDSNLYRYVNNGPTNGTDASGLDWNVEYQRHVKQGTLPTLKNGQLMTQEQFRTWYEFWSLARSFLPVGFAFSGCRITSNFWWWVIPNELSPAAMALLLLGSTFTLYGGSVLTKWTLAPSSRRSTSAGLLLSPQSKRCLPRIHRSPSCVIGSSGGSGMSSGSVRPTVGSESSRRASSSAEKPVRFRSKSIFCNSASSKGRRS